MFTCRAENKDPVFYPDEYLVGISRKTLNNVLGQFLHDYVAALNCNFWKFRYKFNKPD